MKKLMIVAAAIGMAISAQAARVSWASGTLYTAGVNGAFTDTAVADGSVTGYLYILTSTEYNDYKAIYDGTGGFAAMSKQVYEDLNGTATSYTGVSSAGKVTLTDGVSKSSGYVYAAVIYTMTQDDQEYYIADIGKMQYSASAQTAQGMGTTMLGSNTKDKTTVPIVGWTAVPEPTSGLLMLLGVAGLALRRRRA